MTTTDEDRTPLVAMAHRLNGEAEVDRVAILLMEAWGKGDPNSAVAEHPASYVATFVDMARAVIKWQASRPITDEEVGRGVSAFIKSMTSTPDGAAYVHRNVRAALEAGRGVQP